LSEDLGLNFIRLGVMWAGWEPTEGTVNATYVSAVRTLLDAAADAGIAVLIDLHQDVISRATCGEGVPDWAVTKVASHLGLDNLTSTFPLPVAPPFSTSPPPYGDCEKTLFTDFYQSYASNVIFGELYSGILRPAFLRHWESVAAEFGSHGAVLGFELINEPWSGNVFSNPAFANGRYGDEHALGPLYRDVTAAVRPAAPKMPIFFEKSWADELLPAGFNVTVWPGDEENVVFSYHNYCLTASYVPKNKVALCEEVEGLLLAEGMADAARLRAAPFLSEFGACNSSGGNLAVLASLMDGARAGWQSRAYWQYKAYRDPTTTVGASESFFHADNMSLVDDKVSILAQPYVEALDAPTFAGALFDWDASSSTFSLSYTAHGLGDTIVSLGYASFFFGPTRPHVSASAGATVSFVGPRLHISAPAGTTVKVKGSPA
jgi:endoglycosylceramidase